MNMKQWCKDVNSGRKKDLEKKKQSQATSFTSNSTWPGPESKYFSFQYVYFTDKLYCKV